MWGLLYRGRQLALPDGQIILGRGSACDLILEDPLASRAHARLTVTVQGVFIEDLGSANGVYVNEQTIDRPTPLQDGDRILIGTQELSLFGGLTDPDEFPQPRAASDLKRTGKVVPPTSSVHVPASDPAPQPSDPASGPAPNSEESTLRKQRPELLEYMVHELLGRGQLDQASRLLDDWIGDLMHAGRGVGEERLLDTCMLCMDLAEMTGRTHWIDRVVEVHLRTRRLIAPKILDRYEELVRNVAGVDATLLQEYQQFVASLDSRGGALARELLSRISGLPAR